MGFGGKGERRKMKITKIYKCIKCDHQLRTTESTYKSPCPICGGPMILYYCFSKGEETGKAASYSNRKEGVHMCPIIGAIGYFCYVWGIVALAHYFPK